MTNSNSSTSTDISSHNNDVPVSFVATLDTFQYRMLSLSTALEMINFAESQMIVAHSIDFYKWARDNNYITSEKREGERINCTFKIPKSESYVFERYQSYEQHINYCAYISRRNLIVSLVSEYDFLIDALIRIGFKIHPKILDSSDRKFTFSELSEFNNMNDARNYLIDKEIENVMRDSHSKQIEYIGKTFGTRELQKIPGWDSFVEITERRNVFVHCNGLVSRQYLSICKQNKISLPDDCTLNSELDVDLDYFMKSYKTILKVGAIITHKMWRQFKKEEIEDADESFNMLCLKLIVDSEYDFAIELLDYGEANFFNSKKTKDATKMRIGLNKAQAYKWKGDKNKMSQILSKLDLSAASDDFKLANLVLRDNFQEAANLVGKIGSKSDYTSEEAYRSWPIFKEFRKSQEFLDAFEVAFGKKFDLATEEIVITKPDLCNSNADESNEDSGEDLN